MPAQRKPRAGRRPGNVDTRGQIMTAAREAFAEKGFAGASMRGIAAAAGVDAALIHHYFDTKEQLFLATSSIPVPLPQLIDEVTAGGTDDLGVRLVERVLQIWDSALQPALVGAVRTMLTDPAMTRSAAEFLTLEVVSRVVAGRGLDAAEERRRAGLAASQVLGLILGRYVFKLPALAERPSEELVAEIGPTVQRYLDGKA